MRAVVEVEGAEQRGTARSRAGRWRAGVVVAGFLVLAVAFTAIRLSVPSDGTETRTSNPLSDGEDVEVIGRSSGLRSGDVVLAIDGRRVVDRVPVRAEPGDRLTYQVRRDGQVLDVEVPVRRADLAASLRAHWPSVLLVASVLLLGLYVFRKRPADAAAQMLAVLGASLTCAATYWVFPLHALELAGGTGWWASFGGAVAYSLVWPVMLHFALVFPRPSRPIRRHPAALALPYLIPLVVYGVRVAHVRPGAATPLHRVAALVPTTSFAEYVVPPLIVAAFVIAYRNPEDASTRTRMRLLAGAFGLSAVAYLALWKLPTLLVGHPWGPEGLHFLLFLSCPIAISAAILRVHLFDIDIVVRRSIVYGALLVSLTSIYAAALGVLGWVFGERSDGVILAAAALVAVLFAPLHRRIRSSISRVLYGERDDPYAIVSRLGERLQETPASGEVLPGLVETVAQALRLPYVAVELLSADGSETAARRGTLAGTPMTLPLTQQGELIGHLVVGERSPGEGFGRRDCAVLNGLASQVGMAVQAARATIELQRSRERLVAAREEERKRLRRDLHDGLGPTLAATALQVQTAGRLVSADPATAISILQDLSQHIQGAISDVRSIVHDLRPPSLDQLGLRAAVEEQAARFTGNGRRPGSEPALQVDVEAEGDLQSLPAAVEVAAYRIVCEALNNASRHGGGHRCRIRLVRGAGLDLEIADDGRGIPPVYRAGVGLESMRQRAEELGGSVAIEPLPTGGTRVMAHLPLTPS